jgi:hypothetical protein
MTHYLLIKNKKLRALVMTSESIQSLSEKEIEKMLFRIFTLPEKGQQKLMKALEKEQSQIRKTKRAKGITPLQEKKKIDEHKTKLMSIKHQFDASVRKIKESHKQKESDQMAEDLLQSIP